MKTLLLAVLAINFAHAFSPPIDGGKDVPFSSFDYVDVVKLENSDRSVCTGTKVSPQLILTAAHCAQRMQIGNMFLGVGKVIAISIHPKYQAAVTAKNIRLKTLYDIAFIKVEGRQSKRTQPYPKIISAETKPAKRGKVELAGFGSNESFWNGERFDYKTTKSSLQIGDNKWTDCPIDFFDPKVNELEKLNNNLQTHLSIKAARTHIISDNNEVIESDGNAMILVGDSGSPALERDHKGEFIISGVASNIDPFFDGSGEASVEIEVDGKKVISSKLSEMPDNWGLRQKASADFPEIQKILKENNLENSSGVVIKRKYKQVTKGNFADLAHPDNQNFIKAAFN